MQFYVCGFMFSPDKSKVLLIEKLRPSWQRYKLNGIGGKIEPGEYHSEAMVREFWEETGISTIQNDWFMFCTLTGFKSGLPDFTVYFFESFSDKYKDAYSKTDEKIKLVSVNALSRRDILPNLKIIIPLALDETGIIKPVHFEE